jgi:hypothetical protein
VFTYTGRITSWAKTIVDSNGGLASVSCPTAKFCVAVDGNGYAFTYSNGAWSSGTQLDTSNGFTDVSCPSSAFCMAVDGNGGYSLLSGAHWSQGSVGTQAVSVSCPVAGYCVAVDNAGGFSDFQHGSWSPVVRIDGNNTFKSISCAAATTCVATDANNNVLYYQPAKS